MMSPDEQILSMILGGIAIATLVALMVSIATRSVAPIWFTIALAMVLCPCSMMLEIDPDTILPDHRTSEAWQDLRHEVRQEVRRFAQSR